LLTRPGERHHIAQFYQDEDFLIEALTQFVRGGLAEGEGVVVLATSAHWEASVCRFAAHNVSLQDAESRGQLAFMDAGTALSSVMVDGMPDWKRFQDIVGTVINLTRRKYPRVRAFGEMVNLLWQRREHAAALRLEELWNHLIKVQDLSVCCAYRIDNPHEAGYEVCGLHSHLIPARDYGEFEASVNRASEALVGPRIAEMLRALASAHRPLTDMPVAQSTVLWMNEHMPVTARKVLSRARRRHRSRSPAVTTRS
jgi:hypothetical protein